MRALLALLLVCLGTLAWGANAIAPVDYPQWVLLPDGRGLVVCGNVASKACYFYDADLDTYTATTSCTTVQGICSAVLLPDGRVFAAGGDDTMASLAAAEVFDPVTEAWTAVASLPTATTHSRSVVLADGSVLVSGGQTGSTQLALSQRYSPTTGMWTTATMNAQRVYHTMTVLDDGSVLVTGGLSSTTTSERYDPATNTWTPAAAMSPGRWNHCAVKLLDGRVLVVGDHGGSGATSAIYDPVGDAWGSPAILTHPRTEFTAQLLFDGRVAVIGGYDPRCEVYDPGTGAWTLSQQLPVQRGLHGSQLFPNGRIAVVGGYDGSSQILGTSATLGQVISFDPPASAVLGDPPITLVASAQSGLAVTFAVLSGPATVSGSTLTLTGAGTVVVRAEQAGSGAWLPAARTRSIAVQPPVDAAHKSFLCGMGSAWSLAVLLLLALCVRRQRT
jgi:hypothetical protein